MDLEPCKMLIWRSDGIADIQVLKTCGGKTVRGKDSSPPPVMVIMCVQTLYLLDSSYTPLSTHKQNKLLV